MTPIEILDQLRRQEITVRVDGDFLDVAGNLALLTDDTRAAIRANKEGLLELLRQPDDNPAPIPVSITEPPSYVKRCPACGCADWGCVGAAPAGGELWGCLSCLSSDTRAVQCPKCEGVNIVHDAAGRYCVDCRSRPDDTTTPEPKPTPAYIDVQMVTTQRLFAAGKSIDGRNSRY